MTAKRALLVFGSRTWTDQAAVTYAITSFRPDLVVHGGARGADTCAGIAARLELIPVEVFPADWQRLGRRAGFVRNAQMADFLKGFRSVGGIVAGHGFRSNGESPGTDMMARILIAAGIPTTITNESAHK